MDIHGPLQTRGETRCPGGICGSTREQEICAMQAERSSAIVLIKTLITKRDILNSFKQLGFKSLKGLTTRVR